MRNLPHRIQDLSPAKRKLFEMMQREKRAQKTIDQVITPRSIQGDCFPLSFAQQRLWFFDQLEPESPLYNIPEAVHLKGPLNVCVLQHSFREIIRRHEILRTNFVTRDGQATQVIHSPFLPDLPLIDLSLLIDTVHEATVQQLMKEEAQHFFHLAYDPLLRMKVLRLTNDEHIVLFTMHHIISDGWSMRVFTKELATLYAAFLDGKPSPLPELPIQYIDYALWQRSLLQGKTLENLLTYWQKQLKEPFPELRLPADRARSTQQNYRGALYSRVLSSYLTNSLIVFARKEGVTPFVLLLTAFTTLLYHYSDQQDILVGSPIANRKRIETEGLIGCFINNLILRADLSGDPEFLTLLDRIRKMTVEAYDHQDLPFEKLIEVLRPERNANYAPLIQAVFTYQKSEALSLVFPALTATPLPANTGTAKIDILVSIVEDENAHQFTLYFEYNTELFERTTIVQMADHFCTLLDTIVKTPQQCLSSLLFISEREKQKQLVAEQERRVDFSDRFYASSNMTKNQFLIWMGQKLQPELPIYNAIMTFTITGNIQREHFQRAFQELVRHTDTLRTVIQEVQGVPQQKVLVALHAQVEYIDFSDLRDPQTAYTLWVNERSKRQLNLEICLFDAVLLKTSEDRYIWYLNQHHIITDAWSTSLISQRMAELYELSLKGQLNASTKVYPRFQDYIDYERKYRETSQGIKAEAYWERKLAESLDPINFYGKHVVKATTTVRRISYELEAERTRKLKELTQQTDIFTLTADLSMLTVFMTLLFIYLSRISGNRRLSIGMPFHARPSGTFRETPGLFMEACPLRVTISENETMLSLLKKVRAEVFESLRNYPYATVNLKNRAYDVLLNYHNAVYPSFNNLPTQVEWIHSGSGNDSLNLQVQDFNGTGNLVLAFDFHCDVFNEEQAHQAIRHFLNVLDAFLAEKNQPIHQFDLLSAGEKHQLVVDFNATRQEYPKDNTVHLLFEEQVSRTPEAIAIVFGEQSLTYCELNQRANQLARFLQKQGITTNVPVGIFVEYSLEMIIGLVGILKAGGVYVPLNPAYPKQRIALMLDTSQIDTLLLQWKLRAKLPIHSAKQVYLDKDWELIAHEDREDIVQEVISDTLMYMIYTSGSTGRPKGTGIYHRGFVNLLYWFHHEFSIIDHDRFLLMTSLSFDLTQKNLFAPLLVGGTICLLDTEYYDAQAILTMIAHEGATIVNCTPSAVYPLVDTAEQDFYRQLMTVRYLFLGGEPIAVSRMWPWVTSANFHTTIVNTYGPTECTDVCSFYRLHHCEQFLNMPVPIGTPIFNVQLFILDKGLSLLPTGVVGELYIAGDGVGMGYLHEADLNALQFVPNPFSDTLGARLYKTGDLARHLPNGTVEFMGRIDNQVKIRGFRIEVGEIETAIHHYPEVKDAIVLVREDVPGVKRLVAYVVPQPGKTIMKDDVLRFLKEKLPDYMVPSSLVMIAALPLTLNGKVDRDVLAAMDAPHLELQEKYVAPSTPIEKILATIWEQVLGIKQVGIYDNFFALGGDSILSIQIIARANQAGLQLTPKHLFQSQKIAELALVANPATANRTEQGIITGPVPLTPIQWNFFRHVPSEPHYFNQAILLTVPADLDPDLLRQTIAYVLRHHDALRLRFFSTASGWQQINKDQEEVIPFLYIDLSTQASEERYLALQNTASNLQKSFNLTRGPIVGCAHFYFGKESPGRFLLIIHHLVVDGVSWRILLEDFLSIYTQLCKKEPVKLPPKTLSFQKWAQWLVSYAQSDELHNERPFWLRLSAKAPAAARLPLDMPGGSNTGVMLRHVRTVLTVEETQQLLHEATRPYHSHVQELLLVALLQSLADWTEGLHLQIDMEGHGREEVGTEELDISRTVGWFTSIYPVFFTLPPQHAGLERWIKAIKEQVRAVPNKGIGYGLLRYLSQDQEVISQLSTTSQAQISFNYMGLFDQIVETQPRDGDIFQVAPEAISATSGPQNTRSHLLNVVGMVTGGQLHITWGYSEQLHRHETIEALAAAFRQHLRALLGHCLSLAARTRSYRYTPSDFPLAQLTQTQLERVVGERPQIEDLYPLTPLQHGILFHSLNEPDSGVYIIQLWCQIHELDEHLFSLAWQYVIAQHTILRTSFVWQGLAQPLQLVETEVTVPISSYDWCDRTLDQQHAELTAFLLTDRERGFDIQKAPLMRLTLIRISQTCTQLVWTHHHLLLDGWSLSMLIQEVFACYKACSQGKTPRFETRRPYRDYLFWLQAQGQGKQEEEYWRRYLAGFQASTPLWGDQHNSPARDSSSNARYAREVLLIDADTSERWQQAARQQQVTLNTLLQGAWAVQLSRYSGQCTVAFGTVVAGRPPELRGMERMLGLFINTLVVCVSVNAELKVSAWLQQLQEQQVEQRQYEYTPLVKVHNWSEVPNEQPLFESLLVFENYPVEVVGAEQMTTSSALRVEEVKIKEQTNYPLTLVAGSYGPLHLHIDYDRHRFTSETVQLLLQHLRYLLEQLISHPEQPVGELTLLNIRERQQVLQEWNATGQNIKYDTCLSTLFEQQAIETPDTVAVVFDQHYLTYSSLDEQASQLAVRLQAQGIGPDVLVGVCIERSCILVITLLAILKAGGAYVPLDPSYPAQRLAFMMQDAQVSLLLTQAHLRNEFVMGMPVPIVCVEKEWENSAVQHAICEVSRVRGEHMAYVIYTSGSTGKPKGVIITQQGLSHYVQWSQSAYGIRHGHCSIVHSSLSFDLTITSLFPSLICGATVWLAPEGPGIEGLLTTIRQISGPSLLKITPAHLDLLGLALSKEELSQVARTLVIGGEALTAEQLERWRVYAPETRLINEYGPTETVVGCSIYEVKAKDAYQGPIPIGHPIANTQIYVLDEVGRPVAIGVPGELFIGGAGLARGYHKRPDVTAERFVPNPFCNEPGARLYRTGDRGCYQIDGTLEYLGRSDSQVKLHGYRIELREIEAILRAQPLVNDAFVCVHESEGRKELAAYVVKQDTSQPLPQDLQAYAQKHLPAFMVPTFFHVLDAFPLTPNGKIDTKALPAPDDARREQSETFVAPRTSVEAMLAQIWADILHLPLVSIFGNFFELGGHSLLAIQVVNRISALYGKTLSTGTLFHAPTIAQLATLLQTQSQQSTLHTLSPIVPLHSGGNRLPFFCVHPVSGDLYCYLPLAYYLDAQQPLYGIQAHGITDGQEPLTSIEEMATSYVEALLAMQPEGPYLLGGYSLGGLIAFEMAKQLQARGQSIARLILLDSALVQEDDIHQTRQEHKNVLDEITMLLGIAPSLEAASQKSLFLSANEFSKSAPNEQHAYLLERFNAAQLLTQERERPEFQRQLSMIEIHIRCRENYRPRGSYHGPLTLLACERRDFDPIAHWTPFVAGPVELQVVPGDHFSLLQEPHVKTVALQLQQFLDKYGL